MNPSTTSITLNLQLPNIATVSWAVQGDLLSRHIEATLVDGSAAWYPQAGYDGVIRARKPDGTVCVYDVDDDDNPAVTWDGNVATIAIVQQVLAVPGSVFMQLEFYDTNNARISAFGWCMNVQPSAVTDTQFLSTDYYNILSLQIAQVLGVAGSMTPSDTPPLMDGTANAGVSPYYSRGDHVHPSDTSKADADVFLYFSGVACSATTGDFATVSNAAITANHVVTAIQYSKPEAITSNPTWTTANGSLKLNGTCTNAACTATIALAKKGN